MHHKSFKLAKVIGVFVLQTDILLNQRDKAGTHKSFAQPEA